uniref:Tripartite motif-containing protein 3-like n=1 Tax=Branchiostoma floridae TaxID=7739 RepID=C3YHY8_BRAFL|eukprot:XP_002604114.1 hypothetical protein BRAFLDRAFT_71598 [Branchiostoma floridae]
MAAAPSSLGEHFREELTCSICLELFTRPKVLRCGHTFCLSPCLENLVGRGGALKCPIGRQQVRLPPQGVAGLPDSHIIANMCERLRQQTSLSGETREQPQSVNRCSFHPSEVLKVYCKQCQIPVCEQCLEEAHDDHRITTIKKAAQERGSTIQALINEGKNIMESYLSFLRILREEEKTLNEQKQQTDNSIIQAYNQMVLKLTERKDHLLSESQQSHSDNIEIIQTERNRVLAYLNELFAACDRAEQELQQGWVEFLSQHTTLTGVVGRYRGKAAPTPVQTQPAVFQPTDTPVPVLGHVTVQSLPSAPNLAVPVSRNGAAGGRGHHHGNQRPQPQKVTFGGSGTEQLKFPCGISVSDEDGTLVRTVGQQQGMMHPWYITVDGEGNILVSDQNNHCVYVYNTGGRFLFQFGGHGSGEGQLKRPQGICTDRAGNIIVADSGNSRVEMFDKTGQFLKHIATDMKKPQAVAIATQGQLVVSDSGEHRVSIFQNVLI